MTSITASSDPSNRPALAALRRFLTEESTYSLGAVVAIVAHVTEHGTLDDAPFVYPEDIDALTQVFVNGFEPVPFDDRAWGSPEGQESRYDPADDMWNPTDTIRTTGPIDFEEDDLDLDQPEPEIPPPLTDEEREFCPDTAPDASWKGRRDDVTLLEPISGGSDRPLEPSPTDRQALNAMTADTGADFPDALPGSGFPVRDRHSPEALANIRRLLWGV